MVMQCNWKWATSALLATELAACATPPPRQEIATSAQVPAAAPGLKAIRVNGTVLNYLDSADSSVPARARPTIILVHGTLGYLREWRGQMGAFAAQRRTIAYSRRYHQPNPQIDDGKVYSAESHAADLAEFIRALGLGPVDLVGHSYGGTVVVELARRHPELVHALVLGEPALNLFSTPAADDSIRVRAAATIGGLDSARARFSRGDSLSGMRAFIDASLGPGAFDALPSGTRNYFLSQMLELRKEMLAPGDAWIPRMSCADLRPLRMPVLMLLGENTIPIYHGIAEQFKHCLPATKSEIIPGVGHMHTSNSPALNKAVLDFLESVPR